MVRKFKFDYWYDKCKVLTSLNVIRIYNNLGILYIAVGDIFPHGITFIICNFLLSVHVCWHLWRENQHNLFTYIIVVFLGFHMNVWEILRVSNARLVNGFKYWAYQNISHLGIKRKLSAKYYTQSCKCILLILIFSMQSIFR